MGPLRASRLGLLLLSALASLGLLFAFYYSSAPGPLLPGTARVVASQPAVQGPAFSPVGPEADETFPEAREPESRTEKLQSCAHPLSAAAQQHSYFGKLFNFSIPVLLWGGLSSPELWDHLSQRSGPYGWQGLTREAVASTLHLLNDSASGLLWGAGEGPGSGCVRCAVVGNGGILNGSRQGRHIDTHHFVFRLNGAVTKGFEEDVGTKTSFYGFTVNTMKNSLIAYSDLGFRAVPQGKDLRYIFIPSDPRDYMMLRSAILGVPVPEGVDKGDEPRTYFGPEASARKFRLLHPEFIYYLTERFLKSEILHSQFGQLYMPSTGALMLLTALHTCDQVSAYGFITANYRQFSDHYYERVKKPLVFYANHDLLLEAELWQGLHQAGIMRLYQR
ncbi:alpha-N-acetylgalactosaminide alpha-2,6-sialyltransferase 2 isoform X2 [Ornithorhynchus anatinus]|uniref:alpha-N-acetylgalactosaminide alpha-2,6-sialyltransferase 2 isoform X2 n=1 Tax=Ornithorhynchus anatinus TaxID=9258 RepID=UPI0010A92A6F|nr:alpha-N-acetylgalactosaminide alpha-2,6-sialyltransferase 2 isoform X2 [Ornithorhynchus anatinus]